ncbi:hypothetical protein IM687_13740 [Stutzerimonas stutzeri]|uniref:hypothetical protein n=1 Tax=Stutzerimonas stutzeri TaxID=316 RepID=UPI0018A9ACB6|nr:hypothetical protein [Stutzerimonas stutzeri]QPI08260.1 hypothetical protein IM687_13740 [Stutzerimonas stutzeri]
MTVPVITPLPPAPTRADAPSDFTTKADAFVAAQVGMVAEFNASATFVNQRAVDSAASAQAAAASEAAAEADRAEVAANTAAVASNTATVVVRADEVAANTLQVASNTQQVAANTQAVADALASIADGPVTSVAGNTGVVTLEQLRTAGVATQAGTETLTNKTVSGPRASMAQYIDKTITNAAATGTVTLDLSAADVFDLTLAGNTTLALSNAPALSGETFAIVIRVRQGATAYSLAWFSGITWLALSTPATPAANKIVEYIMSTTNGTSWLGRKGAVN